MKRHAILSAVLAMFVIATGVQGQDRWYVDDDTCPGAGSGTLADPFCSIQDGIDAASDTDTVLVSSGTYNELVDFVGKAITLQSADGPDVTTIDGTGLNDSVVKCVSGEGPNTMLVGFTITGGDARYGGGMYNSSSPTVTNCTFTGNTADDYGGGMFNDGGNPTVTNCTFGENTAHRGGGMFNDGDNPTVTNCTFTGNTADSGGGMFNWDSSPTVDGCTFSANTAISGGGIFNREANPTVTNCTFSGNLAMWYGGGMFNWDSSPTVDGCTFSVNTAIGGGGIKNREANPTVTDCTFSNNSALAGGGMANSSSNPAVTNCTFSGNSASGQGGGMNNWDSSPTVDGCTFSANTAIDGGGMRNSSHSDSTVSNCTFTGNTADHGGGMFNSRSNPAVTNCTFSGNSFTWYGGGMDNYNSSPTVDGCTFSANTASWYGGGMRNDYYSDPTVINCTFTGNAADKGGGMSSSWGSDPTVSNCTFSENSAMWYGGGMYNGWLTNPTVTNCTFSGNMAAGHDTSRGGGMANHRTSPTVTNCTFSGNSASGHGGGMDNSHSTPTVTNCTFAANSASNGKALACDSRHHSYPSTVVMTDSILWDGGDEIWNNDGSTISINYSDVQGSWPGDGNVDADPLFIDSIGPDGIPGTEDDDLRLSPGSPCIDAGDNDAVPPDLLDLDDDDDIEEPIPFDLDGFPRFVDDPDTPDSGDPGASGPPVVDMGAYEYQPPMVAPLDIMPQRCPNRLPRNAQGLIRIALVGTESFDVSSVELDSLLLKRADGLGGSIAPVRTPPGLAPKVRDVATPFKGDLCECHRLGKDGVDDLLLVFAGGKLTRTLQLEFVLDDPDVILTLSGLLNNGSSFEGSDCVRIHPRSPRSKPPSPRRGETSR